VPMMSRATCLPCENSSGTGRNTFVNQFILTISPSLFEAHVATFLQALMVEAKPQGDIGRRNPSGRRLRSFHQSARVQSRYDHCAAAYCPGVVDVPSKN